MSDEQFLARWSRRKQEAKAGRAEPAPENTVESHGPTSSDRAADDSAPAEELSNLPPIESINAATDITAFLRKGIPQELSRAALRRAWTADPAIRDFVGLAENAWDFNDPNAMAGFGALDYSTEQVAALVRRIVDGVVEAAETVSNAPTEAVESADDALRSAPAEEAGPAPSKSVTPLTDARPSEKPGGGESHSNSTASQPTAASEDVRLLRRTHGGALPR